MEPPIRITLSHFCQTRIGTCLVLYLSLRIASIHKIKTYLGDLLLVACAIIHVFGLAAAAKFCGPGSLNLIPYPCHVCSCSLRVQDVGSGAIPFGRNVWRRSQLPEQPDTGPLGMKTLHQTMSLLVLCSSLHPGSHRNQHITEDEQGDHCWIYRIAFIAAAF
ncbi:hypothetical protein D6D23_08860 [Aureobasidium pullulans]|nr:hypothetical protein D6D23_08860 [Aureobasidium pullulans]